MVLAGEAPRRYANLRHNGHRRFDDDLEDDANTTDAGLARPQYCGAKAPDVLLHVDHIDPVAGGGSSDVLNLATACVAFCDVGSTASTLDISAAFSWGATFEEIRQAAVRATSWSAFRRDHVTERFF